ncbi:MAG: hypothetical protein HYY02_05880 [Chloroflexi bacterium]|nr:hypothetical protein [Chloroflexota bacterium]
MGDFLGSTGVMVAGGVGHKGRVALVAGFLYGLALIGFGLSSWFWLSLALAACLGALAALVGINLRVGQIPRIRV